MLSHRVDLRVAQLAEPLEVNRRLIVLIGNAQTRTVEETEEQKKAAAKRPRRAPRFEEPDEEEDEINYSGRIH